MSSEGSVEKLCGIPLKWLSLFSLVAHSVAICFLMHVSRTRQSKPYLSTTAVFLTEVVKFVASFVLQARLSGSMFAFQAELQEHFFRRPRELMQTAVPSVLYTVQGNMLFIALTNLAASTYQVTYQFKIITTALFSVTLLKTQLSVEKWASLLILALGVAVVGKSQERQDSGAAHVGSSTVGLLAVACACVTSGFAGVYMEMTLKNTDASIWIRNMQLSFFGMIVGFFGAFYFDGDKIQADGFFQGYTVLAWVVVLFQALGGILIAIALKYADSILKCFSASLGIVATCAISSIVLHEAAMNAQMIAGTFLVVASTSVYALGCTRVLSVLGIVGEPPAIIGGEEYAPLLAKKGLS
eukprot:TRINITY_DN31563_c0_g1_i1.p1 TRINITY_DN31563_c0_g1~~TRINITY_DN31563_c0_g1_i1.p1  ORF type:complete len:355 (-),score=84.60 TRINITY_DN31563_c0_g1_i1:186-1250(-)